LPRAPAPAARRPGGGSATRPWDSAGPPRQRPDVQDLLLRASLLDRVNGELADLLTGRPGSERSLLELEDANAFVESLDPERTWFRYHHLLADFLRLELRRPRCREAIALAERYGWGTEPVIAPALIMLAGMMVWTGEFDEGERWLRRAERALQTDTGPDLRLHVHMASGLLHAGRGRHHEAFAEFDAAEDLASQLAGSHARASRMTGWLLAAQARAGMTGQARATLAALDDQRAGSGEIRNAPGR
jgi:hypothetical protein